MIPGDDKDSYQAKLKIRGGAIIPTGKIIQNTNEKSLDPLTLLVCLDEKGEAHGTLYGMKGIIGRLKMAIIAFSILPLFVLLIIKCKLK